MRVDFMIIGAQKCGTSSVAFQLAQHPEICFCTRKEPQYFSTNEIWRAKLDEYHSLFSPARGQLCGEASTSYTFLPEYQDTHQRLFEYNPELKLIYIMRQPVERIVSHYNHDMLAGRARQPPDSAALENPIYVDRSRYAMQLKGYLELFPGRNVLLLLLEEYVSGQLSILRQIGRFLGISPQGFEGIDMTPQNISARHGHLKRYPGWRAVRRAFYRAPETLRTKALRFARGRGHRLFYRVADRRVEFPESLKRQLWEILEEDVTDLEEVLGRRLHVFRKGY